MKLLRFLQRLDPFALDRAKFRRQKARVLRLIGKLESIAIQAEAEGMGDFATQTRLLVSRHKLLFKLNTR